jgi:hypothetical protein
MDVWTEDGFGSRSNKADSMREVQEGQCRFAMRKVVEFVTVEGAIVTARVLLASRDLCRYEGVPDYKA